MNLKQLKYVLVLSEEGSFSRAAEVLNISQPSLSQYIKKIEKQVGMTLFERSNGNVRLTDAGEIYVENGRKILNIEHRMETQFSDISENKTGSLIVGTSPYRSAGMIPEIAKAFKVKYPGIHLVIEEMLSSELIVKSEKGAFDLCLTILPVDKKIFAYEKVMEEETVLAVPKDYPDFFSCVKENRKYPVIDISDINGGEFVMLTDSQAMQQMLSRVCDEYRLELKKAAVVRSLEAQINMVRKGIGMAIVPTGIERFCNGDEVKFYSFAQSLPHREVVAMWRKDRKLPKTVLDLMSVIKQIDW